MAVVCAAVLLGLITSQLGLNVNGEEECLAANMIVYGNDAENFIHGWRYTNAIYKLSESFDIQTNVTKVRALAFDYQSNELLLVDDEKPDAIWSVSYVINIHMILYQEGAQFSSIVVDPITNNLYFADNTRGIGVCTRQNSKVICTLLISKPPKSAIVYYDLLIYHERGVMFWIEKQEGQKSELKKARMNGHYPRSFDRFKTAKSITLTTWNDKLYVLLNDGSANSFSVHNDFVSSDESYRRKPSMLYTFNCTVLGYISGKEEDDLNMKFSDIIRFVVLDSDRIPRPNPCRNSDCKGICVYTEGHPTPVTDCVPITSDPKTEETKEEAIEEGMIERSCSNSVNGFFVCTTIILFLVLIGYVALTVSPKLRLELRYRIPYLANIKFFDGPYQSGGDESAILPNF